MDSLFYFFKQNKSINFQLTLTNNKLQFKHVFLIFL